MDKTFMTFVSVSFQPQVLLLSHVGCVMFLSCCSKTLNKKRHCNQPLLLVLGQPLPHVLAQLLVGVTFVLQLADLRLVEGLAGMTG